MQPGNWVALALGAIGIILSVRAVIVGQFRRHEDRFIAELEKLHKRVSRRKDEFNRLDKRLTIIEATCKKGSFPASQPHSIQGATR